MKHCQKSKLPFSFNCQHALCGLAAFAKKRALRREIDSLLLACCGLRIASKLAEIHKVEVGEFWWEGCFFADPLRGVIH